jgi:hypothetical protein
MIKVSLIIEVGFENNRIFMFILLVVHLNIRLKNNQGVPFPQVIDLHSFISFYYGSETRKLP